MPKKQCYSYKNTAMKIADVLYFLSNQHRLTFNFCSIGPDNFIHSGRLYRQVNTGLAGVGYYGRF